MAATIAADLLCWLRLLCLDGPLADAEPKTLRYRLLHTAARIVRGQRKRKIKIPETWPWAHELAAASTPSSPCPHRPDQPQPTVPDPSTHRPVEPAPPERPGRPGMTTHRKQDQKRRRRSPNPNPGPTLQPSRMIKVSGRSDLSCHALQTARERVAGASIGVLKNPCQISRKRSPCPAPLRCAEDEGLPLVPALEEGASQGAVEQVNISKAGVASLSISILSASRARTAKM